MTWKIEASGVLTGLISVSQVVSYGPVRFDPPDSSDYQARFSLSLDCADEEEAERLVRRLADAIATMISVGWGAWVVADLRDWSIEGPAGSRQSQTSLPLRSRVVAELHEPAGVWSPIEVFEHYLSDEGEARALTSTLYRLGLQAAQTTAHPSAGLWVFSRLVEQANPDGKQTVSHATQLAEELRRQGYDIPPNPSRNPVRIRAAAVHSPGSGEALPSWEEVRWFMEMARALQHRETRG